MGQPRHPSSWSVCTATYWRHKVTDSIQNLDERINRYVRGELTATEARELAQESLEDPELFEELTSIALAKVAVSTPRPTGNVLQMPRRRPMLVVGAAAAA